MLNLSYNALKDVPIISTLARNSLTTLDLSNNFLGSLTGIVACFCAFVENLTDYHKNKCSFCNLGS